VFANELGIVVVDVSAKLPINIDEAVVISEVHKAIHNSLNLFGICNLITKHCINQRGIMLIGRVRKACDALHDFSYLVQRRLVIFHIVSFLLAVAKDFVA